jgi:two-component system chemotaxis response regulator CheY
MPTSKVKILVVDDSVTTRRIIRRCLYDGGFDAIDEAGDGEQGWLKLSAANPPYDLVIADWHMPNLSGLGLLQKIRANEKFKSTAVVMATAERNKEEVTKVLKLGVTGYVVKPYEPAVLLSAVQAALAKAEEAER